MEMSGMVRLLGEAGNIFKLRYDICCSIIEHDLFLLPLPIHAHAYCSHLLQGTDLQKMQNTGGFSTQIL